MSKISEFNNLQAPNESAVLPIVDNAETRKVSVANLRKTLFVPATETTFGAVKIGNNLSIDANGVLSASSPTVHADWTAATGPGVILNKPTLSAVAISNAYNDLTGRPNIPPAQIQADWDQTDNQQRDYIKNKPSMSADRLVNGSKSITLGTDGILTLSGVSGTDTYIMSKANITLGHLYSNGYEHTIISLSPNGATIITNLADNPNENPQHMWRFKSDGKLILPQGSAIDETAGVSTNLTVNSNKWTFGTNGGLTLPGYLTSQTGLPLNLSASDGSTATLGIWSGDNVVVVNDTSVLVQTNGLDTPNFWTFSTNGSLTVPAYDGSQLFIQGGEIGSAIEGSAIALSGNGAPVVINTYNPALNSWTFGTDGVLTLPNGLPVTCYAASEPLSSLGQAGDMPGTIFATPLYTYVCISEYDGVSPIWVRSTATAEW